MNHKQTLSIIIVSYNTRDMLGACLESIQKSSPDHVTVYVVDNASSDQSADMVAEKYPDVVLIRNSKNVGFAEANNQALKLIQASYIMLLNADTVMLPDTIRKVISFMDDHTDIGVSGCKLLNTDLTLQPSATSYPSALKDTIAIALKGSFLSNNPTSRKWMSKLAKLLGFSASRFDDHSRIKEIGFPRGACMIIRKKALDQVGLLDPDYFFTGEEMDLCYRIKKNKWRIVYFPDAAIIHHDHGSSNHMMGKVFVQTRKSALLFYMKHYFPIHTILMKVMVSCVLLIHCMILTLRFRWTKNKKELLTRREAYWYVVRLHFSAKFRKQNVFSEMKFKYQ